MIQISGMHFEYPRTEGAPFQLQIPELSIQQGEQVVLYGPSGCGKSTLLRLIAGELVPQEGSVHHGEFNMASAADDERRAYRIQNIGFVFQDFPLIPYLNALENTVLAYRIHPKLKLTMSIRDKAKALLAELGLAEKVQRLPQALSQGERQRVAIARALAMRPKLLLADEPTGNLDEATADAVLQQMLSLVHETGASLMLVTHSPKIAALMDYELKLQGGLVT